MLAQGYTASKRLSYTSKTELCNFKVNGPHVFRTDKTIKILNITHKKLSSSAARILGEG
jgi:hypothetical protein